MRLSCPDCNHVLELDDAKIPVTASFKVKCAKCGRIIVASRAGVSPAAAKPAPPAQPPAPPPPVAVPDSAPETAPAAAFEPSSPSSTPPASPQMGEPEKASPALHALIKSYVDQSKNEMLQSMFALFGKAQIPQPTVEPPDQLDVETAQMRALLCDAEKATVDVVNPILKRLGYYVDFAIMEADAIKFLESRSYDLVVTDYSFADNKEGGQKILDKINGQKPDARRSVFVVLFSASTKTVDASSAFFQGANICVAKSDLKDFEFLLLEGQRYFKKLYATYYEIFEETKERL